MKLLIVSPRAFATSWGGDTPRLLQMARGLRRLGWEVELLRCRHPEEARLQAVVQAFPGRVVTAPFFGPFSGWVNHKGLRWAARRWWAVRKQPELSDYPVATARRFARFIKGAGVSRPDVVFGITTGHLESFVSADRLSAHFGVPLVLEYRDPLPHPGCPCLAPEQNALLENCLAHAATVITTTESLSRSVAQRHPVADGKMRTIYSCYDDEVRCAASEAPATGRFVLLHAGALHGGNRRNARSIVKAIAQAQQDDPAVRGQIQLRLIGAGAGGVEALKLATELGVADAVELLPHMSHNDCLAQMETSHVLVVIKFDDAEYDLQVPGKTFQYLGRNKPVLGIMRETEAATILRRSGLGIVVDHSDIAGLSKAIVDLWRHRHALSETFKPNMEYIGQFSMTEMCKRFDLELSSAAGARNSNVNSGAGRVAAAPRPAHSLAI